MTKKELKKLIADDYLLYILQDLNDLQKTIDANSYSEYELKAKKLELNKKLDEVVKGVK